jgi:hypothetical protein
VTASKIAGLLVLNGVLSASIAASERSPDLEPYRWRHRVLVISAPSASDPRLAEMRRHLRQQACGVAERDIVVLEDVGASSFLIRLVGKDGGEKLRRETLVPVDEIFSLIDAMPMREAERRRRPEGC